MILLTRVMLAALGAVPMLLLAVTLMLTWVDPSGPESAGWRTPDWTEQQVETAWIRLRK